MDESEVDLGQVAYEAYADEREWRTFNGDPMPQWRDQGEEIKSGWRSAAGAVAQEVVCRRPSG